MRAGAASGIYLEVVQRETSPALRPPAGHPKFPLLDGLRGLGLVAIVFAHGTGAANGLGGTWGQAVYALSVALALFFVLSGFLLYRPFVAARVGTGPTVSVRGYARHRALRILPAYWVALTLLSLWPGLDGATGDWRLYGFLQIYDNDTFLEGIPVAWSLCVEVTFYALLPLMAAGLGRIARGRHWLRSELGALGGLFLLAVLTRIAVKAGALPEVVGWTLPGLIDWMALGMAIAVLSVAAEVDPRARALVDRVGRRPGTAWLAGLALVVLLAVIDTRALTIPTPERQLPLMGYLAFVGGHVVAGLAAAALVAPAVMRPEGGGWARRLMARRVLVKLGVISYGAYLWHVPLAIPVAGKLHSYPWIVEHAFTPVMTVVMLVLAVGAGWLSYRFVELPFLRRKDRRRPAPTPAVAESA